MRRWSDVCGIAARSRQFGNLLSQSIQYQSRRAKSYIRKSLREPILTTTASGVLSDDHKTSCSDLNVNILSNGLTVASMDAPGGSCTLGVLVNSGAKNECHHPSGVSHFLEKLAFNATEVFPNREELVEEMVRCGGVFECQTSKDITIYAMSGKTDELDSLIRVLGEVVLRPQITDEEVDEARRRAEYEIQVMGMLPPPDNILSEMIHKAAYSRNTYGLPKFCPVDNLASISRADLLTFLATHYRPKEMVVAAVGVSHDSLLTHVDSHFVQASHTSWDGVQGKEMSGRSVPQYTGGIEVQHQDLSAYHQPMPEFAHLVLGLEACASTEPQYVAAAVLQTLMGGGGSFSAGGPGKGMFTRLFTRVLNQYHWVNSAVAQLHCYSDSGLFVVSASAEPRFLSDLAHVIASEMRAMAGPISADELARAKRQLQSTLLMNLELRPVAMEDLGRQILAYRERRSPEWWFDQIQRVTEEDVRDVAQRMLQSKPSVAGFGRIDKLPTHENITRMLTTKEKFIPRIFNVYK